MVDIDLDIVTAPAPRAPAVVEAPPAEVEGAAVVEAPAEVEGAAVVEAPPMPWPSVRHVQAAGRSRRRKPEGPADE